MSKAYRLDMNLDISKLTPNGGMLMKAVPKEADPKDDKVVFDPRGFKERTGAEVFALIAGVAINGANKKCSHDQLISFRKTVADLNFAAEKGEFIANKTIMDIIKQSIKGNTGWPNEDEILEVLDAILAKIDGAVEINENPTPNNPGPDSGEKK